MYISIITYYWVFDMTCILHKDFGLLKKSPRKCGEWWIDLYSCVLFLFRVVLLLCRIYDVYCFVKKNRCSLLENIHFDTKEVLPFFVAKWTWWESNPFPNIVPWFSSLQSSLSQFVSSSQRFLIDSSLATSNVFYENLFINMTWHFLNLRLHSHTTIFLV